MTTYSEDKRFYTPVKDEGILVKIGKDLGGDTNLWIEKIRNAFSKEYPDFISQGKPHFNFTHKDFANGVGVGGATITVGSRILLFPIIIRNKELAPFDTFYDQMDHSWHYMTSEVEKGLSSGHNPYKGLSSDDLTQYDDISSPASTSGWASWRDPAKIGSLNLDKLAEVADIIDNDFERYATASDVFINTVKEASLAYIGKKRQRDMEKTASALKFVPGKYAEYDVALVRKADIDTYSVKLGSYGRREIAEQSLSSEGIRRLAADFGKLGTKILEDADRGEGATVTRGDEVATRVVDKNLTDVIRHKAGMVATFGTYEVMLSNGYSEIGVAYPVMDWDGDTSGKMLFANHENYSVTGSFPGRRTSENIVLPDSSISAGIKGFFIKNDEGQAFCTKPFRIDEIYSDEYADMHIKGVDLTTMEHIHLVKTDAYKIPTRINPDFAPDIIDHEGGNYFIPHNMRFTPLPENQVKILATEDSAIKLAGLNKEEDHNGSMLVLTKGASSYSLYQKQSMLRGNGIRNISRGDMHKMAFLIAICGGGIDTVDLEKMGTGETAEIFIPASAIYGRRLEDAEKVASLMKTAEYDFDGQTFEEAIEPLIPSIENVMKIAMIVSKLHPEKVLPLVTKSWGNKTEEIHKTAASEDEGGESINKIFNLNFLSKENIGYFVEHLETLTVAEDVLTRLLVIARIGNIGLDPGMVEATLEGITEIKERFSQAKVIMKNR